MTKRVFPALRRVYQVNHSNHPLRVFSGEAMGDGSAGGPFFGKQFKKPKVNYSDIEKTFDKEKKLKDSLSEINIMPGDVSREVIEAIIKNSKI